MPKNNPVLYGILTLAGLEKVLQVGGSESLYDVTFFIFPYKVDAALSKTENRRSLAAF